MTINRTQARAAFAAYVAPYDPSNPRIALKVAHTYRVAALCERIAQSLGLGQDDVDLAWLCGLLHDIGRFEQVRRWNTFSDAASTSHAELGAEVLFGPREKLGKPVGGSEPTRVRDFLPTPEHDGLVRTVVACHSSYRLPEGLDDRTRQFADITRDADKIDILRVAATDTPEAMLGCTADELLASTLSPEATRAFAEHRCMLRDERSQPADFLVSFACFAFELVCPESRRIAAEQGYLFELLEHPFGITDPFRNDQTRAELARMTAELRHWLADGQSRQRQSKRKA